MSSHTRLNSHIPREILFAISRGWPVFPVHSCSAGVCSCKKAGCERLGKHPRISNWPLAATTDKQTILQWLKRWPECNWAVVTGEASGVVVLDVDGEEGRVSLASLEKEHGKLPVTLTSLTGRESGGEHRWFFYPQCHNLANRTGTLGNGVDVRANGGYVIIPPSVHKSGREYEWVDPTVELAEPPEWLIEDASQPKPPIGCNTRQFDNGGPILKGSRNTTLTSIAGRMRHHGEVQSRIGTVLKEVNRTRCKPPLPEEEVRGIARSISKPEYGPLTTQLMSLPLPQFVQEAIAKNLASFKEHMQKPSWRKLRTPLFDFARMVKGRKEFAAVDGLDAALLLDAPLKELYPGPDPWAAAFGASCDDPKAEFIASFDRVKAPGEGDALTQAHAQSFEFQLRPSKEYSPFYAKFLSLAGHLQRSHPRVPVGLPTLRIGGLIGVDRKTVGQFRKWAVQHRILTRAKPYVARKEADEYYFNLDMFDWETGIQIYASPEDVPLKTILAISEPYSSEKDFPPNHGGSGGSCGVMENLGDHGVSGVSGGKKVWEGNASGETPMDGNGAAVCGSASDESSQLLSVPIPSQIDPLMGEEPEAEPTATDLMSQESFLPPPQCPQCAGHSLYRQHNVGRYECETCGLPEIAEDVARGMA